MFPIDQPNCPNVDVHLLLPKRGSWFVDKEQVLYAKTHALCTHIFGTCRRLRESCILLCLANLASCLKFRRPFDHTEDMWSTLKLRLVRAPCSRFEICRPLLLFSAFKLTCTTAVSYNILYLLLGHVRVDVRVKSWKIKDETKAWFVWTFFQGSASARMFFSATHI